MQHISFKLFFILFTMFVIQKMAQASASDIDAQVQKTMTQFMKQQAIPGAAVLVYQHGHVHKYFFGYANTKTKTRVTEKTLFELGSITKTFTGLLLAESVDLRKIQFDDKLSDYLTNRDSDSNSIKKITLLALATHSSGLPFNAPNIPYNAPSTTKTKSVLAHFLQTWTAPYAPMTKELYSNLGFGLLAQAMADQAHIPLEQLMQKSILQPLQMSTATLNVSKKDSSVYAQGYTALGKPTRTPMGGLLGGSWGMKVSADDMAMYLEAAMEASNIPLEIRQAMERSETAYVGTRLPNNPGLGLGWVVTPLDSVDVDYNNLLKAPAHHDMHPVPIRRIDRPEFNGDALIDKTGATNGFRGYIGVIPNKKIGIVVLINRFISNSGALQNTARGLLFNLISEG